ncbi:LacI family DNA-binding transcriptional regulator [Herbiconiux moechotypicola]|uniref:LacI family DNA-binding transcriptional regulator n=2 Tax=Herbiconiux moechotypicola TaxID=637393 RepID=A0ABN3DAB7_9MICO
MADVAARAGVSKKTVSNYFNGYRYMRPDTRARIEAAVVELNYKMNISARNLSSGRTGTISLAIPELAHPYFAELAQAVVSAAQLHDLNVLVEVTDGDREHELEILNGSRGRSVDGLIFGPLALEPSDIDSARIDVPTVLIGDRVHRGRFDFVSVDNEAGAHAATRHLIDAGHTRIAALGFDEDLSPTAAAQRQHGYLRALAEAGLPVDPALTIGPLVWNRAGGADGVRRLLASGAAFDAVFGFNDAIALGAMSELSHHGLRVPDDVALMGFDDVQDAAYSVPGLTTVDSGRDWVARTAVDLLVLRMSAAAGGAAADEAPPVDVHTAAFSLVRRSTA